MIRSAAPLAVGVPVGLPATGAAGGVVLAEVAGGELVIGAATAPGFEGFAGMGAWDVAGVTAAGVPRAPGSDPILLVVVASAASDLASRSFVTGVVAAPVGTGASRGFVAPVGALASGAFAAGVPEPAGGDPASGGFVVAPEVLRASGAFGAVGGSLAVASSPGVVGALADGDFAAAVTALTAVGVGSAACVAAAGTRVSVTFAAAVGVLPWAAFASEGFAPASAVTRVSVTFAAVVAALTAVAFASEGIAPASAVLRASGVFAVIDFVIVGVAFASAPFVVAAAAGPASGSFVAVAVGAAAPGTVGFRA